MHKDDPEDAVCEDCKMIGIAKRDFKKGEEFELARDILTGEIKINKNINFIHGTNIRDLKGGKNGK